MIKELLYQHALKFGADWPVGLLQQYADLYARQQQCAIPLYGKTTPEQAQLFNDLQNWLNTIIKTGAVHTPGDWTIKPEPDLDDQEWPDDCSDCMQHFAYDCRDCFKNNPKPLKWRKK